jgi:hypothetical protein
MDISKLKKNDLLWWKKPTWGWPEVRVFAKTEDSSSVLVQLERNELRGGPRRNARAVDLTPRDPARRGDDKPVAEKPLPDQGEVGAK